MLITVITVCFNSAAHIADTLRSVDRQTWPHLEHLIVDGGSIDGTLDVIAAHAQPWRNVVSGPDLGIYDAMNKGFARATGDFVGFLNADDMFADAQAVASIAQAACEDGIDAVFGDLVYVRQDRPDVTLRYWRSGAYAARRLRYGWMPPHPTFYVRRSLLADVGAFDLQFRIAADYDWMLRFLRRLDAGVAYVPRVLVRMRAGGASNRSLRALVRKSREDLRALRKNGVGGVTTLLCKNARKLPQFFGQEGSVPPEALDRPGRP